jgi:hypothetical protein
MRPRDIPRREWPEFLAEFGRRHRSWLSSIDGPMRVVDEPLESLAAEDGAVLVRLRSREPLRIDAQALRVELTERGEELGLDLESERGVTRLRFRAAALPEELDGIGPLDGVGPLER